jgi:transcriptional regulator with XRE-family HTH domain
MEGWKVAEEMFAQRLKRLREAAGLTQRELAEKAGLHLMGLAKIEQGDRSPSWESVQKLAKALGVSCSAFEDTTPTEAEAPPAPRGRPRKPQAPPETPARPKRRRRGGPSAN